MEARRDGRHGERGVGGLERLERLIDHVAGPQRTAGLEQHHHFGLEAVAGQHLERVVDRVGHIRAVRREMRRAMDDLGPGHCRVRRDRVAVRAHDDAIEPSPCPCALHGAGGEAESSHIAEILVRHALAASTRRDESEHRIERAHVLWYASRF